MPRVNKDLAKVALPPRNPKSMRLQGRISPGLWDGCQELQGGQDAGIFYTQPEHRPLRGPFTTGCWQDNTLCYEAFLQQHRTDQVVDVWLQQECVLPVTLQQIAAGFHNAYALLTDGTVLHVGDGSSGEGDCTQWTGIQKIAATEKMVLGLSESGIQFAGDYNVGSEPPTFSTWVDIVDIHCSWANIVGLCADGTVQYHGPASLGMEATIATWSNVKKVIASRYHALALFHDGTCAGAGTYGTAESYYDNVSSWSNIVDIAASEISSHGLTANGLVVSAGDITEPSTWTNITSLCAESLMVLGIKNTPDRRVVSAGMYTGCSGPSPFSDWINIEECALGRNQYLGRTSCNVFACGSDDYGTASGAETFFDYCL